MNDLISRHAAIEKIHWLGLDNDTTIKCDLAIRALPSVNPQEPKTGWIPVSEGLPEDGTWNLFTDGKQVSVERYKADALDHFYPNGRWFSLDEAIAWMPLPEPYKAESEEQA